MPVAIRKSPGGELMRLASAHSVTTLTERCAETYTFTGADLLFLPNCMCAMHGPTIPTLPKHGQGTFRRRIHNTGKSHLLYRRLLGNSFLDVLRHLACVPADSTARFAGGASENTQSEQIEHARSSVLRTHSETSRTPCTQHTETLWSAAIRHKRYVKLTQQFFLA